MKRYLLTTFYAFITFSIWNAAYLSIVENDYFNFFLARLIFGSGQILPFFFLASLIFILFDVFIRKRIFAANFLIIRLLFAFFLSSIFFLLIEFEFNQIHFKELSDIFLSTECLQLTISSTIIYVLIFNFRHK